MKRPPKLGHADRAALRRFLYAYVETGGSDLAKDTSFGLLALSLDHGMPIECLLRLRPGDVVGGEGRGEPSCSVTYRFEGAHGPMMTTIEVDPILVPLIQRLVARQGPLDDTGLLHKKAC